MTTNFWVSCGSPTTARLTSDSKLSLFHINGMTIWPCDLLQASGHLLSLFHINRKIVVKPRSHQSYDRLAVRFTAGVSLHAADRRKKYIPRVDFH